MVAYLDATLAPFCGKTEVTMAVDQQRQLILDQFTRQAVPFSAMHAADDSFVYELLIDTAGIGRPDEVLDVACGPGLVACEVAKTARHVTGIDLTPR
jgi:ubiquinone/menaquinone biosynthesis C-methylase UbiE